MFKLLYIFLSLLYQKIYGHLYVNKNAVKGQVHRFSKQVVINKRFVLNPEKQFRAFFS